MINAMEFAFGTDHKSGSSGLANLSYNGTLGSGGTIGLPGLPIQIVESIPNSVDFRMLFMRRKDYAAAGLTYTPQFSEDLTTWHDSPAVPAILADDGTYQIVSVPYTRFFGAKKLRFARLVVTMP